MAPRNLQELADRPTAAERLSSHRLASLERAMLAEEVAAFARHDLRNRFSTIRNAAFYLERRAQKSALIEDPRILQFFGVINEQLVEAGAVLDSKLAFGHLLAQRLQPVAVTDIVNLALEAARVLKLPATLDLEPATLTVDPHECALALRCLVENAIEALAAEPAAAPGAAAATAPSAPDGRLTIRGRFDGRLYSFEVEDPAGSLTEETRVASLRPFHSTKPGHIGLGLNLAARVARRHGGGLALAAAPSRATVTFAATPPDEGDLEHSALLGPQGAR